MIYDIVIQQGHEGKMTPFYFPNDYTDWAIITQLKTVKGLSESVVFEKKNTVAGGNNDQLVASYFKGDTKVEPILYYSDTSTITADYAYLSIVAERDSSQDREILYNKRVKIEKTIVADGGESILAEQFSHRATVKITSAGVISVVNSRQGFTTDLTVSDFSLSGDLLTVTNGDGEITEGFQADKNLNGTQYGYYVDANTFKVQLSGSWNTDYSYIVVTIFKPYGVT